MKRSAGEWPTGSAEQGAASKSADGVQRESESVAAQEALAALRRAGAVKLVTGTAEDPPTLDVVEAARYLDG